MDKSIGNQKTVKPTGSDDRSMGSVQTMAPRGGAPGGDQSLGSVKTMHPGSLRPAGRRFCAGDVILGRYRVTEELGQGGMGVVYRCFDTVAGIDVALKALPPEVAHNSGEMEEVRANFRLVSKLHHPNIANVNTLERDTVSGDYYLIMECVDGYDVRQWVRRRRDEGRPLTLDEVTIIAYRIAEALDYAHEQGVIHRDIKPSNVRVNFEGEVKVLDFGLAAQIQMSQSRVSQATHGTSGTGPYMAPEQWRGQRQGTTADQYALAATVYELLGGTPPFENHDTAVLREAVLKDAPLPLKGVPPHVNAALLRGLEKVPEQRFESCAEFVKALAGKGTEGQRPEVGGQRSESASGGRKWAWATVAVVALSLLSFESLKSIQSYRVRRIAETQKADAEKSEVGEGVAVPVQKQMAYTNGLTSQAIEGSGEWISLLDRNHSDGWEWSSNGGMPVVDGVWNTYATAQRGVNHYMMQMFSNFVIRLEFKTDSPNSNSGVFLRTPLQGPSQGYEIQIYGIDGQDRPTGTVYPDGLNHAIQEPSVAVQRPAEEWNEMEITVTGQRYTVRLNGCQINDFVGDSAAVGYIGLQSHEAGSVDIRNVRIKEIASDFAETPTAAAAPLPAQQSTQPWTNSLGMVFVAVPGTAVRFSIWAARVQDYQAFVTATGRSWAKPGFEQGPTHPAVNVRWDGAKAFCAWLTEKERREGILNTTEEYRLPMDVEWSAAVGLQNEPGINPQERNKKTEGVYPWGTQSRHPNDAGNFFGGSDGFVGRTSPVGYFKANGFGLYDMGGNVYQWCEDFFDGQSGNRVMRGSSWGYFKKGVLLSSKRWNFNPNKSNNRTGFRCVLAAGGVSTPQILSVPVSTAANPSDTAAWVIPTFPKADSDGWITLFDGKHLYGCDPNHEFFTTGKVFIRNGILWVESAGCFFDLKARNIVLRARVKKVSGQNFTARIGPYFMWFNGGNAFGIARHNGNIAPNLALGNSSSDLMSFFNMEFRMTGGVLTLLADGETVATAAGSPIEEREINLNVWTDGGVSEFQRIEVKVLDE